MQGKRKGLHCEGWWPTVMNWKRFKVAVWAMCIDSNPVKCTENRDKSWTGAKWISKLWKFRVDQQPHQDYWLIKWTGTKRDDTALCFWIRSRLLTPSMMTGNEYNNLLQQYLVIPLILVILVTNCLMWSMQYLRFLWFLVWWLTRQPRVLLTVIRHLLIQNQRNKR